MGGVGGGGGKVLPNEIGNNCRLSAIQSKSNDCLDLVFGVIFKVY